MQKPKIKDIKDLSKSTPIKIDVVIIVSQQSLVSKSLILDYVTQPIGTVKYIYCLLYTSPSPRD